MLVCRVEQNDATSKDHGGNVPSLIVIIYCSLFEWNVCIICNYCRTKGYLFYLMLIYRYNIIFNERNYTNSAIYV